MAKISENLARSKKVVAYTTDFHDEPDSIANAILDLEATFGVLTKEVFPKLLEPTADVTSLEEVLWEIRDNLRHIVYHIRDCKSFKDALDD